MKDVIVIGGGVIGCAVAFELATLRARVTVLERAVPGAEASSAAAGILGAQIEAHGDPALFDLMLASRERHQQLDARLRDAVGFGSGFRRCGVLKVTRREVDFEKEYSWQRPRARVEVVDPRRVEAALASDITHGVHFPDDAQVDPRLLLRALQQACAAAGVTFRTGAIVSSVTPDGAVETNDGVVSADAVVLAAGSWSSMIAGLPESLRRVRPVRGQIVQVETRPPIVRNIVFGDAGYVLARPDGRTLLGSTMEEVGHLKEVTAGGVHKVLTHSLALLPSLADAPITATWAGFRPATAEDRPMIGKLEGKLFVATGHHRNGVLLAPETARAIADLVVLGCTDRDLTAFSPSTEPRP